jgi:hypothetical protein
MFSGIDISPFGAELSSVSTPHPPTHSSVKPQVSLDYEYNVELLRLVEFSYGTLGPEEIGAFASLVGSEKCRTQRWVVSRSPSKEEDPAGAEKGEFHFKIPVLLKMNFAEELKGVMGSEHYARLPQGRKGVVRKLSARYKYEATRVKDFARVLDRCEPSEHSNQGEHDGSAQMLAGPTISKLISMRRCFIEQARVLDRNH